MTVFPPMRLSPAEKQLEGKTVSKLDLSMMGSTSTSEDPSAATPSQDDKTEETASSESYWDAPPEKKLEGKTASKLELSMMATTSTSDDPKPTGGYWDWQEGLKKTLSKLSLGDMMRQHAPADDTEEQKTGETAPSSPGKNQGSYWFWRNPSLKNLSSASLTSLERQSKESDRAQAQGKSVEISPPDKPAGGGYWFWRHPSMKNMSDESLETMEKTARESDRMQGKEGLGAGAGPISNFQHKFRNSWRKSFHKLSSMSLSKLDESGVQSSAEAQMEAKLEDDLAAPNDDADDDAITF